MKSFSAVLLLSLLAYINAEQFNVTKVLDKLLEGYDKRVRPNWSGPPVELGITMYFIRIFDISTKDQQGKADFYLRHMWRDPRLAFQAPSSVSYISLGPEAASMFWLPDTFFPTGMAKFGHDSNMFFRIDREGNILYSVRVFTKSPIQMDLQNFPSDRQLFSLSMESYGYSAKDIAYSWAKGDQSVGVGLDCGSREFVVLGYKISSSTVYLTSGNYSRLDVDVQLSRVPDFYIRHYYFPAIVAFFIVWASFWFPVTLANVRIILILVSFLIGNYLLLLTNQHLPEQGSSTMLEKYITFGMIMAFLGILECATVVYLNEKVRKSTPVGDTEKETPKNTEEEKKKNIDSYFSRSALYVTRFRSHHKLDLAFRIIYGVVFVIYNIWYWVTLSAHSSQ